LSLTEREELLDIFLAVCEWTPIYFSWRPNLPEEGDNHLVELAVAGGARYIVTRNLRDLSRMELRFPDLRVCSPDAFLKELTL
jgi:predicted nucleic acid-binding protein